MPSSLYPLDSAASEVVIAPFHDPSISPTLGARLFPGRATRASLDHFWCWTYVRWETCPAGADAARVELPFDIPLGRFNRLLVCFAAPPFVTVRCEARVNGRWHQLGRPTRGTGKRAELSQPLPGGRLTGVRVIFAVQRDEPASCHINWIGLADHALRRRIEAGRLDWNPHWPGLVLPPAQWPAIRFARGLFFDAADPPALRRKKRQPGWRESFAVLEAKAQRYMRRTPEDDLGEFAPWGDTRYSRAREFGKEPYYWEGLILALVGLVNNDRRMLAHAARYLMCMVHTTHWCQSAESRLKGSTWDQRCFIEEMMTTGVAVLADWLDFLLTDRARDLVRQSLWDKGLAIIERDLMKYEYVHHINQGPWFCRARVLGGLILETHWPRMNGYVDRVFRDQRAAMDNYILADGGTDEGIGYFSLTMSTVLWSVLAYARARQQSPRTLLPKYFPQCKQFVATLSAVHPGRTLMDGDQSTDYFVGDTIPILAGLFPGSVYDKILANSLAQPRPFTYFNHYAVDGLLGFAAGPARVRAPQCIVPTFARLPNVGQLTSRRGEVRIHLTGCKANPSHSHLDKGAFTLELGDTPVLIDRGTVRYDDVRSSLLHRSALHNVLTPVAADGTFPDQDAPTIAVIPAGRGDARRLTARVDLTNVWRTHMRHCRRRITSATPREFTVVDAGALRRRGRVAFHLHSRDPLPHHRPPGVVARPTPPRRELGGIDHPVRRSDRLRVPAGPSPGHYEPAAHHVPTHYPVPMPVSYTFDGPFRPLMVAGRAGWNASWYPQYGAKFCKGNNHPAADESAMVTGSTLMVAGGWSAGK